MMNNNLFSSLLNQTYSPIPFAIPHQSILATVENFFEFLSLSNPIKTVIDFKLREENRRGDVGYKKRVASEDDYRDDKEFFHFHPEIYNRYSNFIRALA